MICIGSDQDDSFVEIEYRGDSWELREYTPADHNHRLSKGKAKHRCRKRWFGTLEQACKRAMDCRLAAACSFGRVGLGEAIDAIHEAACVIAKAVEHGAGNECPQGM